MHQNPTIFSYRFQHRIPEAAGRSTNTLTQQVDFMQYINARILKRVLIMSKRKVSCIYDNLETERRHKERMVRAMKGRAHDPINVQELYKMIVVSGRKS